MKPLSPLKINNLATKQATHRDTPSKQPSNYFTWILKLFSFLILHLSQNELNFKQTHYNQLRMTMSTKIYEYKSCGTCVKALKFLSANNIDFEKIAIREQPPTKDELLKMIEIYDGDTKKLLTHRERTTAPKNSVASYPIWASINKSIYLWPMAIS